MSLISAFVFASLVTNPHQKNTFGSAPTEVLRQAKQTVLKLTTRTEMSAAYLALAQAQNKLGDKTAALASLNSGWKAYRTGSDKGLSEGDAFDSFTLYDDGDAATLPIAYGVEFLVSGSLEKAKAAADELGDTPLGKTFRHDLGLRIRKRFPEAFETLAFTDSEREARSKRKQLLIESIDKVKAEPDVTKRAFELSEIANELERTNGRKEAIGIMRQSIALAPQISDEFMRVNFMAQAANSLWYFGLQSEAKALLAEAVKLDQALVGDSKEVLQAHFSVEQTKQILGLPHKLEKVIQAMNKQIGVIQEGTSAPNVPSEDLGDNPLKAVVEAEKMMANGDIKGARALLRKAKIQRDENGWWHVLTAELQIKLNDKVGALDNLREGARLFVASLQPAQSFPSEELGQLRQIGNAFLAAGDRKAASKSLTAGILRLTAGAVTRKMAHSGDGGNRMVVHDRKSATLHHGAIMLAKVGAFIEATAMARSIPGTVHRAIALAGIVRESNVHF